MYKKKVKEGMMTMSHQIKNNNKVIETLKNEHNANSRAENTVTEMKNPLKGLNSDFELAKERINDLEDSLIQVAESK